MPIMVNGDQTVCVPDDPLPADRGRRSRRAWPSFSSADSATRRSLRVLAPRAGAPDRRARRRPTCRATAMCWKTTARLVGAILLIFAATPGGWRHPGECVELVCRPRLPRLCAAPGLAGAQAQGRDLSEHLGGAPHLADPGCAGIPSLQQRNLRRAGGAAARGRGPRPAAARVPRARTRRSSRSSGTCCASTPATGASASGARQPSALFRSCSGRA